jgi:single-strand DNA-binding protein
VWFKHGSILNENSASTGSLLSDNQHRTRYVIEFVLGPFSELEILARGKAKADADNANEELPMEEAA